MTAQKTVNNNPAEKITPSGDIQVIVPSDSATFVHFTKGIIMSTGNDGTLSAEDSQGKTVTIAAGTLTTGVVYPFELQKINDTGTTATAVIGLF